MLEVLDELQGLFPEIVIDEFDANGKKYLNTRWFYLKDRERTGNVFLEVWHRPKADRIDLIMYRSMMTPSENKKAVLDGNKRVNSIRGMLQMHYISETELYEFVKQKIVCYLNKCE